MFSRNDIVKLAKKILRQQRGLRDHQMIHPTRDWFIGLTVGLVSLTIGAGWSYLEYQEMSERDIDTIDQVEIEQSGYSPEVVERAVEQFRARISEYEALTSGSIETVSGTETGGETEATTTVESEDVLLAPEDSEPLIEDSSEESVGETGLNPTEPAALDPIGLPSPETPLDFGETSAEFDTASTVEE